MKKSLKISSGCGKHNIAVTYDLAIAKLALQIQAEESPEFDNIFVTLGSFRIEIAFLNAFGKIVSKSGALHLLNESLVLAAGSTNGFIKGNNYNRCKRIHELLSLAFEILHFQSYLAKIPNSDDVLDIIRSELNIIKKNQDSASQEFSKELLNILSDYKNYWNENLSRMHGKTAQFWMKYVEMIHLYHDFSRSVRPGEVSFIPKITSYFFALNQPNYARWLVKYHNSLLVAPDTHPEVYQEFKKGMYGTKRSPKSFSRSPIDLGLEQTINADAANQRAGIILSLTNSISARERWSECHFLGMSVISNLFTELNMTKKEDITSTMG